ncbi:DNA-binding transcriptional regulator, LacI/PurR family [Lachnospiraceae bacterium NE2001]|nr:DNA-binding transcriptional regulator, LacI/PurR family [Lachnospiraceae bacterium NE2001]
MNDKKKIGFLVSGITDEFTKPLCEGMIEEASRDDVDIIVIPIKYIDREMKDIPDLFEYQYRTNVESILSENIDVLVVSADTIGCLTTRERLTEFLAELKSKGIPILLAAARMEGYPGVIFDNKVGIIDGITYLVEEMGVKNICMLRPLYSNSDIDERCEAFYETMDYYKLPVGPNSVITTTHSNNYIPDCNRLMDLNPDVEAVFCVTDAAAMEFYKAMDDRGLKPGRDIKIMGFDNSISGSMVTPSLTTVEANAQMLGRRVFKQVRRIMEGWDIGDSVVPTRFILRDSFGSFLNRSNVDEKILDKNYLDRYFNRIFFKFDNTSDSEGLETLIQFKTLLNVIIDYVNDADFSTERSSFLKGKLDEFLRTGALAYSDAEVLLAYINRLKQAILNRFDDPEDRCHVYNTFSGLSERITIILRENVIKHERAMRDSFIALKDMVEDTLNFSQGDDESYKNIVSNLSHFGIKNAYVYIYEKPIIHKDKEPFKAPDTLLLKVAMTEGEIQVLPPEEQPINLMDIYNNQFITDSKYNMVLMPLYFRETLYGSVLYDLTDITYENGEFLANQYATAARVIDILNH